MRKITTHRFMLRQAVQLTVLERLALLGVTLSPAQILALKGSDPIPLGYRPLIVDILRAEDERRRNRANLMAWSMARRARRLADA
jgi:hypothetical protein